MSSSLLYTPSFKYPEGEFRKSQDFMDLNQHHQEQIQNHNSDLMRFRSAPSSFLENLVNGGNIGGVGEDYQCFGPSSPEIDTILTRFMNGTTGVSGAHDLHEYGDRSMKQEVPDSPKNWNGSSAGNSEMIYQSLPVRSLENETKMDCSFGVMNSMMENSMQPKMCSGSGNNLHRQKNNSPAGLFSNSGADNGFTTARDLGNFGASGGIKGEVCSMNSRLNNPMNFESRASSSSLRFMPQIAEAGDKCIGISSPENGSLRYNNSRNRNCHINFANDASFDGMKRVRESDGNILSALNPFESQTGKSLNGTLGLTHHLSLPKTSAEMAAIDKFLQLQRTVPWKIRAKRGCATHPRSIAERMRRTRISERMRKLQELFPEMDKQTNTADMLDLAVEYIKNLQKQVKMLTDTKVKCRCLTKQMQYSNASV